MLVPRPLQAPSAPSHLRREGLAPPPAVQTKKIIIMYSFLNQFCLYSIEFPPSGHPPFGLGLRGLALGGLVLARRMLCAHRAVLPRCLWLSLVAAALVALVLPWSRCLRPSALRVPVRCWHRAVLVLSGVDIVVYIFEWCSLLQTYT